MTDWQSGDLALCISGGRYTAKGRVYHVAEAKVPGAKCGCGNALWLQGMALLFEGHTAADSRGCQPWASSVRFRKVTPGSETEGLDEPRRAPIKQLVGVPA